MTLIIDKKIVTLGRHQQAILAGKLIPNFALTSPVPCSRAVWQGRDSKTDGMDIPAYF